MGRCGGSYRPRAPDASVLRQAVRDGLAELLAEAEAGGGLPPFVSSELSDFVACGDLRRGFARVVCTDCQEESLVGFSCKGRSLCPSCTSKRAALAAEHLLDNVLPQVPFRHYPEISFMWSSPGGSEGNDGFLLDIKAGRSSGGPAR